MSINRPFPRCPCMLSINYPPLPAAIWSIMLSMCNHYATNYAINVLPTCMHVTTMRPSYVLSLGYQCAINALLISYLSSCPLLRDAINMLCPFWCHYKTCDSTYTPRHILSICFAIMVTCIKRWRRTVPRNKNKAWRLLQIFENFQEIRKTLQWL